MSRRSEIRLTVPEINSDSKQNQAGFLKHKEMEIKDILWSRSPHDYILLKLLSETDCIQHTVSYMILLCGSFFFNSAQL